VDNSTTAVLRGANRTLTGATGSLLLERLTASTRNLTAALDLVSSLASCCELSNNHLVHQGHVGDNVKDVSGQLDGAGLLAGCVENVNRCSHG
jgi:hypothetical protein